MVIKFLEQFVLVTRALEQQGLYDPEDGFFYDRLVYPSGESTQVKVQTISGLIPVLPAVDLPPRAVDVAGALGKRFARLRESWADGRREQGRPRARARRRADRGALGDRPRGPPAHARGVLRRGGVPLAARAPRGLEALREQPVHARGRRGSVDRLRAGRVDDVDVRRQLELARADLDAGQLPRDPPVRHLPAVLRRRLQGRVPDRLGRAAHVRRDRAGSRRPDHRDLAARAPTAAARSTEAPSGCRPTRPGRTTCCSTSTSTATTAPASERRTRPAGPRSSPT